MAPYKLIEPSPFILQDVPKKDVVIEKAEVLK
jgi:hypothetical protein